MNKNTPTLYGTITDKGFRFYDGEKEKLMMFTDSFPNGTEFEVIVRKRQNKRTAAENNYYWGVVVEVLGEFFGYDQEDMHELLKLQHNSKILNVKGKEVRIPQSTARLNIQQFEDYCERIRRWAATEYQVVIPLPNEVNAEI